MDRYEIPVFTQMKALQGGWDNNTKTFHKVREATAWGVRGVVQGERDLDSNDDSFFLWIGDWQDSDETDYDTLASWSCQSEQSSIVFPSINWNRVAPLFPGLVNIYQANLAQIMSHQHGIEKAQKNIEEIIVLVRLIEQWIALDEIYGFPPWEFISGIIHELWTQETEFMEIVATEPLSPADIDSVHAWWDIQSASEETLWILEPLNSRIESPSIFITSWKPTPQSTFMARKTKMSHYKKEQLKENNCKIGTTLIGYIQAVQSQSENVWNNWQQIFDKAITRLNHTNTKQRIPNISIIKDIYQLSICSLDTLSELFWVDFSECFPRVRSRKRQPEKQVPERSMSWSIISSNTGSHIPWAIQGYHVSSIVWNAVPAPNESLDKLWWDVSEEPDLPNPSWSNAIGAVVAQIMDHTQSGWLWKDKLLYKSTPQGSSAHSRLSTSVVWNSLSLERKREIATSIRTGLTEDILAALWRYKRDIKATWSPELFQFPELLKKLEDCESPQCMVSEKDGKLIIQIMQIPKGAEELWNLLQLKSVAELLLKKTPDRTRAWECPRFSSRWRAIVTPVSKYLIQGSLGWLRQCELILPPKKEVKKISSGWQVNDEKSIDVDLLIGERDKFVIIVNLYLQRYFTDKYHWVLEELNKKHFSLGEVCYMEIKDNSIKLFFNKASFEQIPENIRKYISDALHDVEKLKMFSQTHSGFSIETIPGDSKWVTITYQTDAESPKVIFHPYNYENNRGSVNGYGRRFNPDDRVPLRLDDE
jgi:hypothetical protein